MLMSGDLSALIEEWNATHDTKLDEMSVPLLPPDSAALWDLRRLAGKHPSVRYTELVERKYAARELDQFGAFFLWSDDAELASNVGLPREKCTHCGAALDLELLESPTISGLSLGKDVRAIRESSSLLISDRIAQALQQANLRDACVAFRVLNKRGQPCGYVLKAGSVDDRMPYTLTYDARCEVCGRYLNVYPRDQSGEISLPKAILNRFDVAGLNQNLIRVPARLMISQRIYKILCDMKATGFWVQPIRGH